MRTNRQTGYFVAVSPTTDSRPPSVAEGGNFERRLAKTNVFPAYFLQKILILWEGSI